MPEPTDRLEREVAAAFTEVLAPQPGDETKLAAMIELALGSPPGGPPPSSGAASARLWPLVVAGGGVVVAAVALLALGREPAPRTVAAMDDVPVVVAPALLPFPEDDGQRVTPDPDVVGPVRPAVDADAEAAPSEPPSPATRPLPRAVTPRPDKPPPPSPTPPVTRIDPDALLRAANQARRARDFAEADRLYTDLQARFPESRAARTSRVPHARLLLDTLDRPADALDIFSAYLDADPRGTLSEEALVGQAQALRRLGRDADARDAWRSLLARFPESVHAPTALSQLAEVRP